ncbi:MAG: hypothetical protein H6706_01955 [Myxococcales bacterium]|nr:hypothetical protein [Myxococcales bacterium]
MTGGQEGALPMEQVDAEPAGPAEGACLPLPPLDLGALGDVPVLGVVPAFLPADPQGWYPDGVVPPITGVPADGPALRPRFASRPLAGGAAAPLQPVVDTLVDEVGAETDRRRLAGRLHALATLLAEGEGSEAAITEALRAAVADDPDHFLARAALDAALVAAGEAVERVVLFDRADASPADLHRAGHLAQAAGNIDWALDIWWTASERHPKSLEPLLASYLHHVQSADPQAAATLAEMLYQATEDAGFWGVLSADRISRARGHWPDEQVKADILATLARAGATPAIQAVGEQHAFATRDAELLKTVLAARIAVVEGEGDAIELAILRTRLGWLLDQLGDDEGARAAYELALADGVAPDHARRRSLALARRHGGHTLVHQLQARRAEEAPSPAERAAALVELAAAAFALDRGAEGRTALARAVELDRTYRPALAALGRAAIELDDVSGQVQLFAAELSALEARARDTGDTTLIPRIVDRAVRLARLQQRGRDPAQALDACRRAMAAAPGDGSAFLAAADILTRLEQWPAVAALRARRATHPGVEPAEAAEQLALAADVFRTRLDDPPAAARLLAQALRLAPSAPYILRRAAEVFATTGQRRAWAEVEARQPGATHQARAGRLFEHGDADEQAAALQAFVATDAATPLAIDGLVRACVRAADIEPLALLQPEHLAETPLLRLAVVEALLAAGRATEALALLPPGAIPAGETPMRRASLELRGAAAAQAGQWETLAEVLRSLADLSRGQPRAELLVDAGDVLAVRAGDVAGAVAAFRAALEADPGSAEAQEALARWQIPDAVTDGDDGAVATARAARRAGDWARHDAVLAAAAEREIRPGEATGLRRAAGRADAAAIPAHRSDLQVRAIVGAETPAARAAVLAQCAAQPGADEAALLQRLIAACLEAGQLADAREAAERLLTLKPGSLPASLALCRIAALTGDPAVGHAGLATLVGASRDPVHRQAAGQALAAVEADPVQRARGLVHRGQVAEARAILQTLPDDAPPVAVLLAETCEAEGDLGGAIAARERAFAGLSGAAAAEQAFALAGLASRAGGDAGIAAAWLHRAVAADPGHARATEALLASRAEVPVELVQDAVERVCRVIEGRLAAGVLEPADLAELARLHTRRGDAVAASVAQQAALYVGAEVGLVDDVPVGLPRLQPADWQGLRHPAEASPSAQMLAALALPLAAALAGPRPAALAGAERWQAQVVALFERLAVGRPAIALAADARWGGTLAPDAVVLAPAREAPIDDPARYLLGTVAAGFEAGRLLLRQHDPARLAAALAALRQALAPDASLAELAATLPPDRAARLAASAFALDETQRQALTQADAADFEVTALAALDIPFDATGRRAGLLACGELAVALDVVLGRGGGSPRARREALAASPEALSLLAWAVSADHLALRARRGEA